MHPAHFVADDWGIANPLMVLTGAPVSLESAWGGPRSAEDVWIGHMPEFQQKTGGTERIVQSARSAGFEKELIETIPDRNGRPVFEIFRFVPGT
jgi:hypothetical protein